MKKLGVDPEIKNNPLGWFNFDDAGRCTAINVMLRTKLPVILAGHDVTDVSQSDMERVFKELFGASLTSRDDLGIDCSKWEDEDCFFYVISITAPKK
jgi:hypothetical protein